MKRVMFNMLAGASLLLCVATVGLWVRSYLVNERFWWEDFNRAYDGPGGEGYCVASGNGGIAIYHNFIFQTDDSDTRQIVAWHFTYHRQANSTLSLNHGPVYMRPGATEHFGFGYGYQSKDTFVEPGGTVWAVVLPPWFVAVFFAVLPMVKYFQWRKQRRRLARLLAWRCVSCGYDLRATPERCPECGKQA